MPATFDRSLRNDDPHALNAPGVEPYEGENFLPDLNRVLLVDDDPVTLRLYEKQLSSCGYQVTACSTGEEAWERYRESAFPLVLLDWLMPGMDGLALCRKIRKKPGGECSMVLVITGCDQPEHLAEVLEAGADDYLTKPVDIKRLEIRLAIAKNHAKVKLQRRFADQRLREQRDQLKKTVKKVVQGKREWESTADALTELVILLDGQGRLLRANKAVELWTGRSVESVKGFSLHQVLHHQCEAQHCFLKRLWSEMYLGLVKGSPGAVEVEDPVLNKFLQIQVRPVQAQDEDRTATGVKSFAVVVVQDITERKQMELELARAREQEIEIGCRIQQSLLIDHPPEPLDGMELAASTIPSQGIDGDFYVFFRHNDHCLDLLVGDVMGKGIPAALIGAATKSHFLEAMCRLLAGSPHGPLPPPADVVAWVHARMAKRLMALESFVTLCYVRFDLSARRITLVDCGHTRTMHYRAASGQCVALQGENMPLGFSEQERFHPLSISFEPGDRFLFYSDGVIETVNENSKDRYGEERLSEFWRAPGAAIPQQWVKNLINEVIYFSGSKSFGDDLTCIAVCITDDGQNNMPYDRDLLKISSDLSRLSEVRTFVKKFLSHRSPHAVNEEVIAQLELAVVEAVTNVMRHAYLGRPDLPIRIEADLYPRQVEITIFHQGEPFDVFSAPPPELDRYCAGGFGLYIIEHYVDSVVYSREKDGQASIRLKRAW